VSRKKTVRSPECIGCGESLAVQAAGRWKVPALVLPLAVLTLFLGFWAWAVLSGHWHSEVPVEVMKKVYFMVLG
jgi:hypothetical protein